MKTKLKNQIQGFTIIEVMIVLTIAGLILLIVFLAVPALQRSSRNTQRKNDVAGVLAAVTNYAANNQGTLPICLVSDGNTHVTLSAAAAGSSYATCSTGASEDIISQSGQFSSVAYAAYSAGQTTAAGVLKVYTGAGCNGNALIAGPSARSIAAFYQLEPATDQCTSS